MGAPFGAPGSTASSATLMGNY